ncbi:MAG: trigger factor [Chitinophagaceae bacterium]|jgi:trigger factor|nr:trigger factor [Chitinophagaceae bacterium]
MATVTRENVGLLTDKLTVHLSKEDYYPAFEKALKNYSKQANVPGFRKGMVPLGHIKKMMGASVYSDEVLRTVEREINGWLEKERPEIFAQPLPTADNADAVRQLDMNLPGDYQFSFEIGLKPAFEVADLTKATIQRRLVKVTEEMVTEEVGRLQTRYGNMTEPEAVSSDEQVLNVTFTEVDAEGTELADGISKTNSLLVSYFAESFRPQLQGLKKDDSVTLTLDEAFEAKEKEWLTGDLGLTDVADAGSKRFKLTITKIGLVEKRELNEEFFNQLFPGKAIATEAEFRAAVKEDIEAYWANQGRGQVHDEIYHYLLNNTAIELPEDFLKRWLQSGGEKPKTAEEVEKEFPSFRNSLKWTLISDKLMMENQLNIDPAELREFAKRQMMGYMGVTALDDSTAWLDSYVDRMMQDRKYVDQTYNQLMTDKLFVWAETKVTNFSNKEMSVEEFTAEQHHHQH